MLNKSASPEFIPENAGKLLELMENNCLEELTKQSIRGYLTVNAVTAMRISEDILPFKNGGCMSYSLMLRILFRKARKETNELLSKARGFIPCEALTHLYKTALYSNSWLLSEEEMLALSVDELFSKYEFGVISPLFGNINCKLYVGSCAVDGVNKDELQVKLDFGKKSVYPEFIKFTDEEEMERVIRMIMLKGCSTEITGSCPEFEQEYIYAIRPPKGNWGMRLELREDRIWGKL